MIPCQACGNQNPIATRYCRKCGAKLEVKPQDVVEAVSRDNADLSAQRWFEGGRSALIIGMFFLTCALVLRYAVVPPMPLADVPPVDFGGILPAELPKTPVKVEAKAKPAAGEAVKKP